MSTALLTDRSGIGVHQRRTDADSYAVTFAPSTDERLCVLAFASALAVDLTMKQKDYGSPLDF
jgi:hypothetical protein